MKTIDSHHESHTRKIMRHIRRFADARSESTAHRPIAEKASATEPPTPHALTDIQSQLRRSGRFSFTCLDDIPFGHD
jgi:hypothetical protein